MSGADFNVQGRNFLSLPVELRTYTVDDIVKQVRYAEGVSPRARPTPAADLTRTSTGTISTRTLRQSRRVFGWSWG